VDALSKLLSLSQSEKKAHGLLHTPAEIAQQPETWHSTFQLFRNHSAQLNRFLATAGLAVDPRVRPTVFLIGAGSSDYIGHSLMYLLRKHWHCDVVAIPSTDLITNMDDLCAAERKYIWISFSRSGDSAEGVAVLELACKRRPDIYHLVISCNANGQMIRAHAHNPQVLSICLDDAVNDRALAMTSSFSNMVVFGQCLAHLADLEKYEKMLRQLIQAGKNFLPLAADCAATLAEQSFDKACFLGSGTLRAVARESALKLLELTAGKVATMSESPLGLRHGPMAALDGDTLVVCFLSGDKRVQEYERSLLREIGNKRLVTTRVVVGGSNVSANDSIAELTLSPAESLRDDCRPPLDVMFGQLLGLFCALRRNLQPDCPSPNGAISRVVQFIGSHS